MSLEGKRALITGASGALGAAMARRFAREGATVLLHANSRPEAVEQLAEAISADGGKAECHVFDLRSDEACAAACARILEGGSVQILVNNAGVHDDAVLPGMRAEQWHKVIDVSLNGFFRVTQPLLLPMMRTRWGRILNISSVAAIAGNRGQVNYAAAKGALNSATKALSDGERHRAGDHCVAHGGCGVRSGGHQPDGACEAGRDTGRGGCLGRVPCWQRGRVHHWASDFGQWRDDLTL